MTAANPTERRQRERSKLHSVARQHDVSVRNMGLFIEDLLAVVDEIGRDRLADAESAVPPSVAALRRAGWWVDRSIWEDTERRVQANKIAPEALTAGARRWTMRGYKKGNVEVLVDFIVTDGAGRKRPDTPAPKPTFLPADPSDLYEAQS